MGNCLTSTRTAHVQPAREPTAGNGRRRIKLQHLPEDVLRGILSKLPAEEVVRTSVLSSEWRSLWTGCPTLSFNGRSMCRRGEEQDTQMFIDCVNAVLQQHSSKGVEGLEVKHAFENKLVDHLSYWISFAMSSRTKNLALDLAPLSKCMGYDDPYVLPSELFDKGSASCLECLQLSFVCFKPPSQFLGFSILRELELNMCAKTTRKDLEDVLCSCCNLEWLSMVKCYLMDELTVDQPLPRLQYLRIAECGIFKIEFHAANLSTLVYDGPCIPIALHHASKLEKAQVQFCMQWPQQVVTTVLLNGIPEVQRLTLEFAVEQVKFKTYRGVWFAYNESFKHEVPPCEYKHLKSMYVSGFLAGRGQVELITYVVENAPAIEAVTIVTNQCSRGTWYPEIKPATRRAALSTVRGPLLEKLPRNAKLILR